ncbi:MAG: ABC transporter substrate-binding protein [Spirochaetaceae bacterium]|nr:ABC transporter substrate-binding protein [Spirochaetaceae bacterium]
MTLYKISEQAIFTSEEFTMREDENKKNGLNKIAKAYIHKLALMLFYAMLFIACQKQEDSGQNRESKGIILGFSQIGAESAWRTCNTRSVRDAAAAAGIQLLFSNAEQKQENQIKAIRSFIAYQVDVIAFVPIVSSGWENVLEEAKEARIPVLVCDRKINIKNDDLYVGYIGTDSTEEGRLAAKFLLKKFEGHKASERPIRIVELSGTEGSSAAIERSAGFRECIENQSGFEIIYSASGDFLRSKGYELMRTLPFDFTEMDALFSHNDGMTLGALDAMKEKGVNPGKDIIIVSIDAEQAAIDALKRGDVNCVIECNPKQGPDIMNLARHLARGESIPRIINMTEQVFYEWDDLSDIPARGY